MEPRIPGGYILLSRKLIESEVMKKPPLYLKVWVWLLLQAYHKPHKNLQRGQIRTSISEIQEQMAYQIGFRKKKPTYKQIRDIIDWMRNPHEVQYEEIREGNMIGTTKVTHGFIVTIENYNFYQTPSNYEGHNESQDEELTKELRRNYSGQNKDKNVKNDKNERRKDLSDDIALQISDLRLRYSDSQLKIIDQYFDILRWTRHSGKIAESVILKIYQEWEKFKPEKVIYALEIYINNPNFHDKKEAYVYGIMRNTKDEEVYAKSKNNARQKPMSKEEFEEYLKREYSEGGNADEKS